MQIVGAVKSMARMYSAVDSQQRQVLLVLIGKRLIHQDAQVSEVGTLNSRHGQINTTALVVHKKLNIEFCH